MNVVKLYDDSCFLRLEYDDGSTENINKIGIRYTLADSINVVVSDKTGFFALVDFRNVTTPVVVNAIDVFDLIEGFVNLNPCSVEREVSNSPLYISGFGMPDNSVGFDGWHYQDTDPSGGKLYKKESGAWVPKANISLS